MVSTTLADGTVVHYPYIAPMERAVLMLVTLTGPWGMCVTRLDTQKRMFLDAVPEHVDSKATAVAVVDHMRVWRFRDVP